MAWAWARMASWATSMASTMTSSGTSFAPASTIVIASFVPATTRSRSLSAIWSYVGLRTKSPSSVLPTRTAPIGPSKGMSDIASAAEAPTMLTVSYGVSWSAPKTVPMTWISLRYPFGKRGLKGRSVRRAVRMALSLGLPSRLMKPPGILPAEDIRSSMSTLKGKKSTPGLGAAERVAVASTTVSPSWVSTAPPAWRASIPVSSTIDRSPTGISKRIFFFSSVFPLKKGLIEQRLSAQPKPSYERPITLDVLFLQVLQETAPFADQLQKTSPRMKIVLVLAHVLRKVPDALRQDRDLNLWRPRVAVLVRVLLNYCVFILCYRQLLLSPLCFVVLSIHFASRAYATTCINLETGHRPKPLTHDATCLRDIPRYLQP